MKKLYLVDVSSLFFRAFFALPHMSNSKGLPTNALYGFLTMTLKLIRDIRPDYMAFCFDSKEPSFRHEMYEEYKAHREEMPEDLVPQVPYVRQLTEVLGIPIFERTACEADDIIGTLTHLGREHSLEVVIVSGDKDFAQLVGPFVSMFDPMKDVHYDHDGVVEKWGVHPEQMIDYLAMVGDSSDNIPGIRGVGPKGAQKLLAEFKTLDGIYKNVDKVSGKSLQQKLREGRESAYLSKKLVTIVKELPIEVKTENLKLRPINKERLQGLLSELEFRTMEKKFLADAEGNSVPAPPSPSKTSPVEPSLPAPAEQQSFAGLEVVSDRSSEAKTEDEWSLSQLAERILPYSDLWVLRNERGLCLGYEKNVIRVSAPDGDVGRVLGEKFLNWKGFDLKEAWHLLKVPEPQAPDCDQMLAAYVIRPGVIDNFPKVYEQFVGRSLPDVAGAEELYRCHLELEQILAKKLAEVNGEKVYREIELPLVPVLYQMEKQGIHLDVDALVKESGELAADLKKIEAAIFELAGQPFNVASPKQLGEILFKKLNLPSGKMTKTGYSTGSEVLEKLAPEYPICGKILEFRELAKLKSTYVDALPQLVDKATGKIHTHFRQAATSTGRLSSVNPNLQNIPIRTERGRMVRKAFVVPRGREFVSADYSQIELRVLAEISGDPGLIRAFTEDLDIHSATAMEIFEVPLNDVTPELRRKAKAVNFGIAYGQGAFGLAESLNIGRAEAAQIIERYFVRFKNVKDYMVETVKVAEKQGYVETLLGRRRYIDELKSKNMAVKKFGERAAINAPIQGTASDIVKKAMIELFGSLSIPMLLQVHDELVFECPTPEINEQSHLIRRIMEGVVSMKVPLRVNIAHGKNWEDAHS